MNTAVFFGFLTVVEILTLVLIAALWSYRPGWRVSETIATGIVLTLTTLSFLFQSAFLLRVPGLALAAECALLIWGAGILWKRRHTLLLWYEPVIALARRSPVLIAVVATCWTYLFLQVLLLPPDNWDSMTYNLARVPLFQQNKTVLLEAFTTERQAVFAVGSDILSHAFLRYYTDYGIALFSLLAYLAIALGTYATARKWFPCSISLTASLVVFSLPELVFQATITKNDIIAAAVAVACTLLTCRLLDSFSSVDCGILFLFAVFGVSVKTTFLAFAAPFFLICAPLLLYKHRGLLPKIRWRSSVTSVLWTLPPAFVLSGWWLYWHNYRVFGGWMGSKDFVQLHTNRDGFIGGGANFIRYLFQSMDLMAPVGVACSRLLKINLPYQVQSIYEHLFGRIFGTAGTSKAYQQFFVTWGNRESVSWFGPLGWLLVLPAVCFAAVKGPKQIRGLGAIEIMCFLVLSYMIGWMPWNNRFMSLVFGSAGLCVAFLLNEVAAKKPEILRWIQGVACLILLYCCFWNEAKPLLISINPAKWPVQVFSKSIWAQSGFGTQRLFYADKFFEDDRVGRFGEIVGPLARVALISGPDSWVYHFFLVAPKATFVPTNLQAALQNREKFDFVLCLDEGCSGLRHMPGAELAWSSQGTKGPGKLFRVVKSYQ